VQISDRAITLPRRSDKVLTHPRGSCLPLHQLEACDPEREEKGKGGRTGPPPCSITGNDDIEGVGLPATAPMNRSEHLRRLARDRPERGLRIGRSSAGAVP